MLIHRTSRGKSGRRVRRCRGVRVGLLLRLRLRLSGLVGMLSRSVEELRCGRPTTISCPMPRVRRPAMMSSHVGCRRGRPMPTERNQSSFYTEAITDCLEFIKARSSYQLPAVKDEKIVTSLA
ncbi:hypothetical protein BRADI_1g35715v3 [Brachypodium distachyon]|uniref:Uncharacterized protein n=1 Tax=Brachypodium distachyon TaxID=15368 RepID=A0A0Q3H570_BRADI|nr:hypothetical protein BRADI_1g35715v3 [Brachypodium distachyon]